MRKWEVEQADIVWTRGLRPAWQIPRSPCPFHVPRGHNLRQKEHFPVSRACPACRWDPDWHKCTPVRICRGLQFFQDAIFAPLGICVFERDYVKNFNNPLIRFSWKLLAWFWPIIEAIKEMNMHMISPTCQALIDLCTFNIKMRWLQPNFHSIDNNIVYSTKFT